MIPDPCTTVAFTGHRTYCGEAAAALAAAIRGLHAHGFRTFLCGMAVGFDLAAAEALKFADSNGETLVIVTADHETGGLVVVDGDEHTGRVTGVYVSDDHTPAMLPVFAYGPGADKFCGTYMNTEIARRIKSLIK